MERNVNGDAYVSQVDVFQSLKRRFFYGQKGFSCYNSGMDKYAFKPYDPVFPLLFEEEKQVLKNKLGNKVLIEHFGSTAVPGLGGKGIIDIYILGLEKDMSDISLKLKKLDYEFKETGGNPPHWLFFVKTDNKERTFHIHLVDEYDEGFSESIAFRDYLRQHPESIREYEEIKKIAAKKVKDLTDKFEKKKVYMEIKQDIIKKIIQKAKN